MCRTNSNEVGSEVKATLSEFAQFAALVWGASLVLFEYKQSTVHPSLSASMTYIFHDVMRTGYVGDLFCVLHSISI